MQLFRPRRSFARRWAWALGALVILCASLLFAAAWYFSTLIAQPAWRRPDPQQHAQALASLAARTQAQPFEVRTADGLRLSGLHLPSRPGNGRAVVMVHGYGGNLLEYAEQFAPWHELGFDVFLYDQRASGASEGETLTAGVLESRDLVPVVDAVRARMPAGAVVGVYGRSGGGASTVLFAGQGGQADFLVVDCAYSDFLEVLRFRLEHDYAFVPTWIRPALLRMTVALVQLRFGVDLHQAMPIQAAPAIRAPVLFITTEVDTAVPPAMTHALHAAVTTPKWLQVYPLGNHGQSYQAQPARFTADLRQFLVAVSGPKLDAAAARP